MIKDYMSNMLESEIQKEESLLAKAQDELLSAPEGFLYVRNTGKNFTCYQVVKKDGEATHHKISGDANKIMQLLKKHENKTLQKICRNNLRVMKRALRGYTPLSVQTLLPHKHRAIQAQYSNRRVPYKKAPFDPQRHIHETACGELVRSKSEVIIANALWHFGIPFNYEELFPHLSSSGSRIFPDFTIHCPDGTVIIWEHWGLLDKLGYCERNTEKLYDFNKHNFIIGKNLIITQDDSSGNCCTELIYHIIEAYILPHFQ